MVQLGRQALEPPGEARQDLAIIIDMGRRLGLDWTYAHPRDVFDEMRKAMPSIAGITWDRLEREGSVTYPCEHEGDPGDPVVFIDRFPTASGKARLVPATLIRADEQPDAEFPWVLITGRQLEHWHTGSMTRRTEVLDAIEPAPVASVHPADLADDGRAARRRDHRLDATRRGRAVRARDDGMPRKAVFLPFCYYEAAANLLTNAALDPFGKIPSSSTARCASPRAAHRRPCSATTSRRKPRRVDPKADASAERLPPHPRAEHEQHQRERALEPRDRPLVRHLGAERREEHAADRDERERRQVHVPDRIRRQVGVPPARDHVADRRGDRRPASRSPPTSRRPCGP
jgi:predicted molibdopterin-dependent oxidoreductase YjgC